MPTQIYKNAAGKRLPSVTTILSVLSKGNGLMHWAWECGVNGLDYRQVRDAAADAGTIGHAYVEADIAGKERPAIVGASADVLAKAEGAFESWLSWKKSTRLRIVAAEIPLVSEEFQYGGTMDFVGTTDDDALILGDLKTGNGTYSDHLIQMAAYAHLWEEHNPDMPITGGFHLLRIGKEEGDWHHHHYPKLPKAWEAFKLLRSMYDLKKHLDKLA